MPRPFPDKYTSNHTLTDDGAVTFDCTTDSRVWPWLKLEPLHPILIQTVNFWASFDSGVFLDEFRADAWTALTRLTWTCGAAGVGYPARGRYTSTKQEERAHFTLELRDAGGALVAGYVGQGVTFRTRNFEGWRGKAKEKLRPPEAIKFDYAAASTVGVEAQSESFLAPLEQGPEGVKTTGLVTKENGLRPNHPYIGGSGDHVNSTHMGELARQFGQLLLGRPALHTGGEMTFDHYVELGAPFEIALLEHDTAAQTYRLNVRQGGRDCTQIMITYRVPDA